MAETKYVSRENLSAILTKIKNTYVQKVDGKGLSTNDLTNELLAKINGMGTVATLNEIAESNLSTELAEKVNAASEGNHSHLNKEELDKIASGDKAKWDQATTDVSAIKADYLTSADKYDDTALAGRVTTVEGQVTTLVGEDTGKSARTIANEELAKQLIPENAAESLDTLTEIATWIQNHPGDASAMNEAIVALQNKVDTGDKTVSAYVTDAIAALSIGDYAKAADLTALAGRVSTLEGASHTHTNKAELDLIVSGDKAKWDAVAADYVKASELVPLTEAEIETLWANA